MTEEPPEDRDLASAASFLMIYAALVGVCVLFGVLMEGWPPDKYAAWYVGVPTFMFLILALIAWGVQNKGKWVWIPAMTCSSVFLLVFPIGTIISYYVLTILWRHRHHFYPFTNRADSVPPLLKRPSLGFSTCFLIFGIPFLVGANAYVGDKVMPSKFVRILPDGAVDIEEYYAWGGITGDFVRLARARIPKEQVAEFAARVGATSPVVMENPWRNLGNWSSGPEWWKPPKAPLFFASFEQRYQLLVGWENGFVYFEATKW